MGKAIADFTAQYPELQVQLTLNDRFIDPIAEGCDLTIRISGVAGSRDDFIIFTTK